MTDVSVGNSLHHKSPLDTLVRQSSRRAQLSPRMQPRLEASTPPRHGSSKTLERHPSSPLLHTRFRASASTAASSFMDLQGEDDEGSINTSQELYWNRDDDSVYSAASDSPSYSPAYDTPNFAYVVSAVGDSSPTLPPSPTPSSPSAIPDQDRQSWASNGSDRTVQADENRQSTGTVRDTWRSSSSGVDPFTFKQYESPRTQVPKVVISSPVSPMPNSSDYLPPPPEFAGHSQTQAAPTATQYSVSNFSRPIRRPTIYDEQSKRDVLERNRSSRRTPTPQQQYDNYNSYEGHSTPPSNHQQQDYYRRTPSPIAPQSYSDPPDSGWAESTRPAIFRSASANPGASNSPASISPNIARSVSANAVPGPSTERIRLPNSPPSPRVTSRASLYSAYSFYQLDDGSRTPSPSSPHFPLQNAPNPQPASASNPNVPRSRSRSRAPSPFAAQTQAQSKTPGPTPDEFLLLGIQHHEANRLAESATCFERAATLDGGCGVGMLMWGLSLRHAWGTAKDEKAAFRWLRRAAEAAVGDLEAARQGRDQKGVKEELVLAIYEVGQCFFHGWGVPQDKKMAVSYFQVAARLGDCEAQQELGYCLANGKGCKKDLKEAAKWYRAAAAQGASTVGLAWIYKSKYT